MASLTQFALLNPPAATGQQLDDNIALVSAQAPIPCTASGSNTIVLVQDANTVPIIAYTNNMQVSFVAAGSNTSVVTIQVGSLPALTAYKSNPALGPVALTGSPSELIVNCAVTAMYDPALGSGAGGFHVFTSTAMQGNAVNFSQVQIGASTAASITKVLSGTASLSFSIALANSSEDQTFSVTGIPSVLPNVGDFVQVVPPSLAVAGVGFNAMVLSVGSLSASTSAATINVRAFNTTAATVQPPNGVYRYLATRAVP
jgi:hypothetical protein